MLKWTERKGVVAPLIATALTGVGSVNAGPMNWTVNPTSPVMSPGNGNDVGKGLTVVKDGGVYRACHDDNVTERVMGTESSDGISWSASQFCIATGDTNDANTTMVIKDGTYYLWVGQTNDDTNVKMLTSTDGCGWIEQGWIDSPVNWLTYSVLPTTEGFEAWYREFDGDPTCYSYGTSTDGLTWSHEPCVMPAGAADEFDAQIGYLDVIKTNGVYEMWYNAGTADPGSVHCFAYATSLDGRVWEKQGCVSGFDALEATCNSWAAISAMADGNFLRLWVQCQQHQYVYHASASISDSIPAVPEWAVVAMALLMLTAGTLVCARRRPVHRAAT